MIEVYRTAMAESSTKLQTRKRKRRFDWTTKTDPDTGAVTRFCSRCQEFLPLDRFYPSTLQTNALICQTHHNAEGRRSNKEWARRHRGKPGSIKRARVNLNRWILKQKKEWSRWDIADIENVLVAHSIPLNVDTRLVQIRPQDPTLPFNSTNAIVKKLQDKRGCTSI